MLFSLRRIDVSAVRSARLRALGAEAGDGATAWALRRDDGEPERELVCFPRSQRVVVALGGERLVALGAPSGDPHDVAIAIARLPFEGRTRRGRPGPSATGRRSPRRR